MMKRAHLLVWVWPAVALMACKEQPSASAPIAVEPAQAEPMPVLDRHAQALVAQHGGVFKGFSPARKTGNDPVSYLTTFRTDKAEFLTVDVKDGDSAAGERNRELAARWQAMYCTDTLKDTLRQESIAVSSGQIVDTAGKPHSLAMCIAQQDKAPPQPGNALLADVGAFSTAQICKAALALMYGRDHASMTAQAESDHVRVTYTRSTDGRHMSYRCRLEDGHVLSWDDSLAGARWYGNAPGDSRLAFQVKGKRLLVQDIIRGEINREKSYSSADIARD